MKCFNHEDRDAVAYCQHCGKALCRECAEKYTPCLCDDCFEALWQEQQRQKQAEEEAWGAQRREELEGTVRGFMIRALIGFGLWLVMLPPLMEGVPLLMVLVQLLVLFSVPFGWHLISDGQARIHVDLIASVGFWVFLGFAKGVLSFFVGVPALFIQLSEVLRAKTELDAMAVQK